MMKWSNILYDILTKSSSEYVNTSKVLSKVCTVQYINAQQRHEEIIANYKTLTHPRIPSINIRVLSLEMCCLSVPLTASWYRYMIMYNESDDR